MHLQAVYLKAFVDEISPLPTRLRKKIRPTKYTVEAIEILFPLPKSEEKGWSFALLIKQEYNLDK